MPIHASCQSCFHEFTVGSKYAGKKTSCPECGEPVRIPKSADADFDEPSARRSGSRPRRRQANQKSTGMLVGAGIGLGGAAILGAVVFSFLGSGPVPMVDQQQQQPIQQNAAVQHVPATAPVPAAAPAVVPQQVAHANTSKPNAGTPAAQVSGSGDGSINSDNAPGSKATNSGIAKNNVAKEKPADDRVKHDLVDLISIVEPSVVRITVAGARGAATGSGFVVNTNGMVVTNVHVMAGAKKAEVEFSNGTKAPVVGFHSIDQKKDIAIIKIDLPPDKLIPLPLADALPKKGLSVVAFGAPHGLSFTTTEGIISALRPAEEMREQFGTDFQGDWIQTSTPISPGNSGGPLVNHYGEVVAMNTMQMTIGQNLNFAMSAVDIAEAIAKAPEEVKPITPTAIQAAPTTRSRTMAADETTSDRGQRLLSEVSEIFLVNATSTKTLFFDRTGLIWTKVINKSKAAVEKSKIELSIGEPAADAAIMFVVLEMKTRKNKNATAGTQELHITAEVICNDEFAKKGEAKVCRIWKGEENVGTISINSLAQGNFPQAAEDGLSKFFSKFRSAVIKARMSQKDADGKTDKSARDDKSSGKKGDSAEKMDN